MTSSGTNAEPVWDHVDAKRQRFIELSDRVFDTPEVLYTEKRSAAAHVALLEEEGFRVTHGVAGIPTAVIAEAGDEGPVVAILGEYDALPSLSQQSGTTEHTPVENGGAGHGCGHNLLGSAAVAAATAVKDWLAESGIKARVRYYGCPAEEGGAAKTHMVRAGLFDDVDAAVTWHPASWTGVDDMHSLANTRIDFSFVGKSAHAAGAPHLGRSALDACELTSIGVNYLREHMPSDARIHYAYLDVGGEAPNVVQSHATVRHLIRARNPSELLDLVARVRKVAEGAAMMTETTLSMQTFSAVSNLVGNRPLEEAMQSAFDRLGPVQFDEEDREFARAIRKTFGADAVTTVFRNIDMTPDMDLPLCDFVAPLNRAPAKTMGSTDVGDVSWVVPTVQARVTTCAMGTPFHTWQTTTYGKTPTAHKGMIHAAKIMADTAAQVIKNKELREAAKADRDARLAREPYLCPLPESALPPIPA